MNYFEFRDKYLTILIKLKESTNQIYNYMLNDLNQTTREDIYEKCLILNLIEFLQGKIETLMNLIIEAASIPYEMGTFKIVKAICKMNCYLYSVNMRTQALVPECDKNFKIIYHIYIEQSKRIFNELGYVEATFLIVSSDKLLWERRAEDFTKIKAKTLEQVHNLYDKKLS